MITLTPELPLAFVFEYIINFMYTEIHNDIMDATDHPIDSQTYQHNTKKLQIYIYLLGFPKVPLPAGSIGRRFCSSFRSRPATI